MSLVKRLLCCFRQSRHLRRAEQKLSHALRLRDTAYLKSRYKRAYRFPVFVSMNLKLETLLEFDSRQAKPHNDSSSIALLIRLFQIAKTNNAQAVLCAASVTMRVMSFLLPKAVTIELDTSDWKSCKHYLHFSCRQKLKLHQFVAT
jgi:hypothetical protein